MAFPTTYTGWISLIRDWLTADEYSDAQVTTFLDLAQLRLNREMSSYGMEAVVPITVLDLNPIDILSSVPDFNKIRLVVPRGFKPLDVAAINEMQTLIQEDENQGDDPAKYCIDAGLLYTYPQVAVGSIIDFFYYKKIPYLASSTPGPAVNTTVFTTDHPDAVLYAALLAAAPYMQENEIIDVWDNQYKMALETGNFVSNRIKLGSTPLKREVKVA